MNLEQQRQTLLQLQAELVVRAQRLDMHQRRQTQDMEQDFADRAVQSQNDEVIDSLDHLAHQRLAQIALALERIDLGTYTDCAVCGQPIAPARLQQIPETHLCVQCA